MMLSSRRGFTLVELSIVLVILGLLVGGVLAGQSLIRAAELRRIATESTKYMTATHAFRDKYFAIPGDMLNATSFWKKDPTISAAACATSDPDAATNGGTCNGNGNGFITSPGAIGTAEPYQYWRQLVLAGLIEGNYSGVSTGNIWNAQLDVNIPRSGSGGSTGWYALSLGTAGVYTGDSETYATFYGNAYEYGALRTNARVAGKALTPTETWNVDIKADDGLPGRGRMIARFWGACTLAVSNADLDAAYRLTDDTKQCGLYFTNLF